MSWLFIERIQQLLEAGHYALSWLPLLGVTCRFLESVPAEVNNSSAVTVSLFDNWQHSQKQVPHNVGSGILTHLKAEFLPLFTNFLYLKICTRTNNTQGCWTTNKQIAGWDIYCANISTMLVPNVRRY